MPQVNHTQLLQDIERAFSNVRYPGDENLVYDNTEKYGDVWQTKEAFRGKHWKALSIDILNRHRDNLPVFTAQGFCFYLPAWLSASVSYPLDLIDVLPENLIFNLTPRHESVEADDKLKTIVSILTAQQKRVVIDFLAWYSHIYILDRPDLPEDLKDLKRFHARLDRATTFWTSIALSL
jgi:hypothetical protein